MTSTTKTIDGLEFVISPLTGRASVLMLNRLGRLLGPAMAEAFAGAPSKGKRLADMEVSNFGSAVKMLFAQLSDDELEAVMNKLLAPVQVKMNGRIGDVLPVFDTVFLGKPGTALKLLWAALEVNYGDFLGVISAAVGPKVREAMAGMMSSPPQSEIAGPSGAS